MSELPQIILTKRQTEVLRKMRDEDEELVYERGGVGCVGAMRVAGRTVFALLRAVVIRMDSHSTVGQFERYTVSETGCEILDAAEKDTRI